MISPRDLGFRMPAEWEPHSSIWLAWPYQEETWPGKVAIAEQVVARWIREITRRRDLPAYRQEYVDLCVFDEGMRARATEVLDGWSIPLEFVRMHLFPVNDSWIRDYGPSFLVRDQRRDDGHGTLALAHWYFDAWGGKGEEYYGDDYGRDSEIPRRIAEHLGISRFEPGIVLEGGSIEVNGSGALMATEGCLLVSRDRLGEGMEGKRAVVEKAIAETLAIDHFLWIPDVAIEGDDTDGHIDNLARFTGSDRILTIHADFKRSPLYGPLKEHLRTMEALRDANGRRYDIITLPVPDPLRYKAKVEGSKRELPLSLPASYANFLIANNVVLVPVYADANDLRALETIQSLFPDRAVVGIDHCDYVLGLGAVHCSSQQQPMAPAG